MGGAQVHLYSRYKYEVKLINHVRWKALKTTLYVIDCLAFIV